MRVGPLIVGALLVWLCAVGATAARAQFAWFADAVELTRIDTATGARSTSSALRGVDALAPDAEGGTWVSGGGRLVRLDSSMSAAVDVAVPWSASFGPVVLAADVAGSGAWWAQGAEIGRIDGEGRSVLRWRHDEPVEAIVVAGPDAMWLLSTNALTQASLDGRTVNRWSRTTIPVTPVPGRLFLDRSGMYLWVVAGSTAVQLDLLANMTVRTLVALPAETRQVALDSISGVLWILTRQALLAFDRDGRAMATLTVPPGIVEPTHLTSTDPASWLWVGGMTGLSVAHVRSMEWLSLSGTGPIQALALSPSMLQPALLASRSSTISAKAGVAVGVRCPSTPCAVDDRYLGAIVVQAHAEGRELAVSRVLGETGTFAVETSMLAPDAKVVAVATDYFGTVSASLTLDPIASEVADTQAQAKALPTVALTAPANNATFVAPASIVMAASAADSDGTIAKVEFYRDAVLLASDTVAPYTYTWSGNTVGTYKLTAKAYDNLGGSTTSAIVNVQVKANVAPAVTVTAPANNSAFTAPATIALAATASDSDGTITKVEFFQGSTRLATDTTSPYAHSWTNVAGGTYSITAKATDDKGAVTTSPVVTVKVNQRPTVTLTAPAANASFAAPATITLKATAADGDGTIAKVQFFRNGVLLGTDTSSPYAYTWSGAAVGTYALTAVATDNLGATTTSSVVNISVAANAPPSVAITAPPAGTVVKAGTTITIAASAADADGTIARVEFHRNASGTDLIAADTTAPHSIATSFNAGIYSLTAVAIDNLGARTTSAPIALTVEQDQPPTIAIVSPQTGAVIHSTLPPDVLIVADVTDPENAISEVRFYMNGNPADELPTLLGSTTAPPYEFLWTGVPHNDAPGNPYVYGYDLYAEVTDRAGTTVQSDVVSIAVRYALPRTVTIAPQADSWQTAPKFAVPGTIVITAVSDAPPGSLPVARMEFLANGVVVGTLSGPNGAQGEYAFVWRAVAAGNYTLVARAHDSGGGYVDSSPTLVTVAAPNARPLVALTAPVNAQAIDAITGVSQLALAATASDADGTVSKVEFRRNGQWMGQAAAAPYAQNLSAPYPGRQMIVASAVDSRGGTADSKPVFVEVPGSVRAPKVVLTSPLAGARIAAGAPVTLAVDAATYDGSIAKVDYYDGNNLVATRTTAPFSHTMNFPEGVHTLSAIASVAVGGWTRSAPVQIVVVGQGGTPPAIEIEAPAYGQILLASGAIPLAVSVSDPGGVLQRVQYYAGSTLIATATAPPYSASWSSAPAGLHQLHARGVFGVSQLTTQSSPVQVEVRSAEFAELRAPAVNAFLTYGERISLEANAGLVKGVAAIEFQVDGVVLGTVALSGGNKSGRATLQWDNAPAGAHSLRVRAVASDGTGILSVATPIVVGTAGVSLAEPFENQGYVVPGSVRIAAVPSLSSGTVMQVDFFGDGQLLGSRTAEPYVHIWTGASSGSHVVQARVRDNTGRTYLSRAVPVTVMAAPTLTIDPGIDGSTASGTASISGRIAAPPNASVIVNGRAAILERDGRFLADGVRVVPGSNAITIALNTIEGATVSRVVQLTGMAASPFAVHVDLAEGLAPLVANLIVQRQPGAAFQRIEVDLQDDGSPDVTLTTLQGDEARIELNYPDPGIYTIRVTVYDTTNRNIFQTTRRVRAVAPSELAYRVVDVYRSMTDRLSVNDPAGALKLFAGSAQERYGEVFTTLAGTLPQVVTQLGDLVNGVISESWAELTIARGPTGSKQAFMIYLVRGEDGLWRIDSM